MRGARWALLLCAAFPWVDASAQTVSTIVANGDPANRVDIVVVGDGYTSAQQAQFDLDARASLAAFLNFGFFADYSSYFNIRTLFVASVESGASHQELMPPIVRNTAFNSFYGCGGIDRLICANNNKVVTAVNAALPAIQRDYVFVLVNDTVYGGSGGSLLVSSIHSAASQIVLHEFGHTHGLLADEYVSNPPPCTLVEPAAANATTSTDRNLIKWNYWIDAGTSVPTAGTAPGVPGLYEGANYCATGMYRPTYNSMMRSLGVPFDQINEEQMVRRLYNFVTPIDAFSPATASISVPKGTQPQFTVSPLVPVQHALQTTWAVDSLAAGTGPTFNLDTAPLSIGAHTVVATVRDTTTRVRRDPANLLVDTQSWTVTVGSSGALVAAATLQAAPLQATLGQNVVLTATVQGPSGAATPTGPVRFLDGATQIGVASLDGSGHAVFTTSVLTPGMHSISVAYPGDAAYLTATSGATQVAVLGPSATTLVASALQVNVGQNVTLTASVSSSFVSQPPAGTVRFLDGATQLASVTLDVLGHPAVLVTSSLAAGTHSITAQYDGDATHLASVSAATVLTVTVAPDFTLSATPLTLNLQSGGAGQVVLTATPNGASVQTVSFSCSGLPSKSTCSFAPSSLALNATVATTTLTVSTTATVAGLLAPSVGDGRGPTLAILCLIPLLGLGRRPEKKKIRRALVAITAALGLASCGGGGSDSHGAPGTPAGTSVIVVTASTSGAGAVSHTVNVTLNVTN